MRERTLVLIKPDGTRRGLAAEIKRRLLDLTGGQVLLEKRFSRVNRLKAQAHYFDLGKRRGAKIKERAVAHLTSGDLLALVLEGEGIINKTREVIGATEPIAAAAGTIRGDLASDSYLQADREDRAVENLVHASLNPAEAEKEIALWFTPSKKLINELPE